jgi:acyl carrier protein
VAYAITGYGCLSAERFSAERELGKRGHKYMSAATRLLCAASRRACAQSGFPGGAAAERRGVVVGTSLADYGVRRAMDQVLRSEGVRGLSAAEAPNSSVNIPASMVAIRESCQGVNLTLTNPRVAGFEALHWAGRFLDQGLVDVVIAGATEDRGAIAFVIERASEAGSRALLTIAATGAAFLGRRRVGTHRPAAETVTPLLRILALVHAKRTKRVEVLSPLGHLVWLDLERKQEKTMNSENATKIKELVCDILELDVAEVTETSRFKEDHNADSLRAIEILATLEKTFSIRIPQAEMAKMVNLSGVHDVVKLAAGWA